jgi:hypothetical protein
MKASGGELGDSGVYICQNKLCRKFTFISHDNWHLKFETFTLDRLYTETVNLFIYKNDIQSLSEIIETSLPKDIYLFSKEEILSKVKEFLVFS